MGENGVDGLRLELLGIGGRQAFGESGKYWVEGDLFSANCVRAEAQKRVSRAESSEFGCLTEPFAFGGRRDLSACRGEGLDLCGVPGLSLGLCGAA